MNLVKEMLVGVDNKGFLFHERASRRSGADRTFAEGNPVPEKTLQFAARPFGVADRANDKSADVKAGQHPILRVKRFVKPCHLRHRIANEPFTPFCGDPAFARRRHVEQPLVGRAQTQAS